MSSPKPASPREFWIAAPEFGDFDYAETQISRDPNCVNTERDFKFNAIRVLEATPAALAAEELVEALERFIRIDDIDKSGAPTIANQGQAMDGYSKLANYESCVEYARTLLARARGESSERKEGGGG